jgi:tripartite-type tricarboxylate transporter receptor subunit TctC
LFGPAHLPRDIVDRLARALQIVLARADVKEQLGRYAFEPQSSSPEEMSTFLKEQLEVWRRTVQDLGIVRD